MSEAPRIFTDEDHIKICQTVEVMRKMRTAATPEATFFSRLLRQKPPTPPKDPQLILRDGYNLAIASGDFLIAQIQSDQKSSELKQNWEQLLDQSHQEYDEFRSSTSASTTNIAVGQSLLDYIFEIRKHQAPFIKHNLLTYNRIGSRSIPELLKGSFGIFAPFSGDLLTIACHRSYLLRRTGRELPILPVILSGSLNTVILPESEEFTRTLSKVTNLSIFQDAIETGDTGRTLYRALSTNYPNHTIHEPRYDASDVIPFIK